ncbi:hypothetical protein F5Y02DRAFT_274017 [Annulohypoxylon stygium]|nr:hypothetical protein F5Y02DRAFT_274017 [Annulohypoxylon stygium]
MGCCFSRSAGPNAPYPGGSAASPSARAINSPPQLHPSATDDSAPASRAASRSHQPPQSHHPQQSHSHHHQHRIHSHRPPLSQHIDKPLRRHEWVARDRSWTRSQLDTERADFFDTRVTGRPEVWQVLKATLEVLWGADGSLPNGEDSRNGDESNDALATAQSILKAAEVTLPTGDLSNGVYDALGNYYALPEWIVCDPLNVAEERNAKNKSDVGRKGEDDMTGEDTTEEIDEDEALRRREEKGKAVADIKNMMKVRARLSENLPDVIVSVGLEETVRIFAKRVAEESSLPSTKHVRVAYMGKILKENMSLESQGWKKGHVVNALVFNK